MVKINKEEYELLKSSVFYWKWIAREEDGRLYKFHGKPKKIKGSRWTDRKQTWLGMSSDRFQFIQWEDENPYNVAELIEEYEIENGMRYDIGKTKVVDIDTSKLAINNDFFYVKENEETEVKNIEWLKEELNYFIKSEVLDEREIGFELAIGEVIDLLNQLDEPETLSIDKGQLIKRIENYISLHDKTTGDVVDGILEIVKQLPEMEVLSPEWIDKYSYNIEEYWEVADMMDSPQYAVSVENIQNAIVPKRELPAIPQFVAEWIEEMKQDERPLYSAMSSLMNKTNHEWAVWKSANKNFSEIVAQAWLDGFAVEEEPKYFAKIKGHEKIGSDDKYWNYCITDEGLDVGGNKVHADVLAEYVLNATRDEWENLGINEDNADFVLVEEL